MNSMQTALKLLSEFNMNLSKIDKLTGEKIAPIEDELITITFDPELCKTLRANLLLSGFFHQDRDKDIRLPKDEGGYVFLRWGSHDARNHYLDSLQRGDEADMEFQKDCYEPFPWRRRILQETLTKKLNVKV